MRFLLGMGVTFFFVSASLNLASAQDLSKLVFPHEVGTRDLILVSITPPRLPLSPTGELCTTSARVEASITISSQGRVSNVVVLSSSPEEMYNGIVASSMRKNQYAPTRVEDSETGQVIAVEEILQQIYIINFEENIEECSMTGGNIHEMTFSCPLERVCN